MQEWHGDANCLRQPDLARTDENSKQNSAERSARDEARAEQGAGADVGLLRCAHFPFDIGSQHDRVIGDAEIASWGLPPRAPRRRGR